MRAKLRCSLSYDTIRCSAVVIEVLHGLGIKNLNDIQAHPRPQPFDYNQSLDHTDRRTPITQHKYSYITYAGYNSLKLLLQNADQYSLLSSYSRITLRSWVRYDSTTGTQAFIVTVPIEHTCSKRLM